MRIAQWTNSEKENQEMLELIDNAYGDVEIKNILYINWQYNENPQGKSVIVLCFDHDKNDIIIGQESVISSELNLDNKCIKSSITLNSIVNSNYRRRGIFSKLLNALPALALKEGIVSAYGVPNTNSHKTFLKEGWKEITKLPLLIRLLTPSNYFGNTVKNFVRPFDFFYKIKIVEKFHIEHYKGNFIDFDNLTSKLTKRILISQNRNNQYLKWRYADHPTRKYDTYVVRKKSEIIGYIITRNTKFKGKQIGVILDFVTDGESNHVEEFVNLVKFALLELQKKGDSLAIATMQPLLLEYNILCKSGFFKAPDFLKPAPLQLMVNIFDKNNPELKSLEHYNNWFFSFGDYDVF